MTKRICLCVGVINHQDARLTQLSGAKIDAKNMFSALTNIRKGGYDLARSVLLIDPKKMQITQILANLVYDGPVDTFTFFFAGHGGVRNGAFALYCSDTNCDRFIATALPITEIFQILNDAQPKHSNIIVDACGAAGMITDFGNLLNPKQLVRANSISFSIFATCAANRGARETDDGGVGTRFILDCIDGKKDCGVSKDYLSLDDMGAAVSNEFGDQSPSLWSFNISGASMFVKNPRTLLDQNSRFAVPPDFGSSALPMISLAKSEQLWRLYVDANNETDARTLQSQIENAIRDIDNGRDQAQFLIGLSESFASRGVLSDDCFASLEILCAVLFAAQSLGETSVRNKVIGYLLMQIDRNLANSLLEVSEILSVDYGLLPKDGTYTEFYALPIRISKVFSWSLVSVLLAEGNEREFIKRKKIASRIFSNLNNQYKDSFSLLSEEQAPYLLVISELASRFGLNGWSKKYFLALYENFISVDRKVSKVGLPPEKTLQFLRWRCGDSSVDSKLFCARSSELLFVLFYHFQSRGQLEVIRYDFKKLDHSLVNTFVPDSYSLFSSEIIDNGTNIHFEIGFDIFTARDFSFFLKTQVMPSVNEAKASCSEIVLRTALPASLIYPDRVAWFLSDD